MDPNDPCVFCEPGKYVTDYGKTGVNYQGYPIYWMTPINPVTEGHVLIVSQRHIERAHENPTLFGVVAQAAAQFVRGEVLTGIYSDYNIIQSNGPVATQTVNHVHVDVVPRRSDDGLKLPWTNQ